MITCNTILQYSDVSIYLSNVDRFPTRETAANQKIKEAYKRVVVANHPDAGGSHYLASKINEAKDLLLNKTKASGSAF